MVFRRDIYALSSRPSGRAGIATAKDNAPLKHWFVHVIRYVYYIDIILYRDSLGHLRETRTGFKDTPSFNWSFRRPRATKG